MLFKNVVKLFKKGSVCVTGQRGSGKDMLMANVVTRRKKGYVSNIDYGGMYYPFEYEKIDTGNTFHNFIEGDIKPYVFPYPDKTDFYLSDLGCYFPSQYCNELNRRYPNLPIFCALSRHLGLSNVHFNVQNLNRAWDKFRELSETYIYCRKCICLFGLITYQKITIYDKASSCQDRVKPCRITVPFLARKQVKQEARMYREKFFNQYGNVKTVRLLYINKSSYDTRHFKKLLGGDYIDKEK